MFKNLDIFNTAQSLAVHASARQAISAQNIANADTPGYAARDVTPFQMDAAPDGPGFAPRTTRTGHFGADATAAMGIEVIRREDAAHSPNGNSVSLEEEMLKSVDAKRDHDKALAIYKSSLRVLRTALGR